MICVLTNTMVKFVKTFHFRPPPRERKVHTTLIAKKVECAEISLRTHIIVKMLEKTYGGKEVVANYNPG